MSTTLQRKFIDAISLLTRNANDAQGERNHGDAFGNLKCRRRSGTGWHRVTSMELECLLSFCGIVVSCEVLKGGQVLFHITKQPNANPCHPQALLLDHRWDPTKEIEELNSTSLLSMMHKELLELDGNMRKPQFEIARLLSEAYYLKPERASAHNSSNRRLFSERRPIETEIKSHTLRSYCRFKLSDRDGCLFGQS